MKQFIVCIGSKLFKPSYFQKKEHSMPSSTSPASDLDPAPLLEGRRAFLAFFLLRTFLLWAPRREEDVLGKTTFVQPNAPSGITNKRVLGLFIYVAKFYHEHLLFYKKKKIFLKSLVSSPNCSFSQPHIFGVTGTQSIAP